MQTFLPYQSFTKSLQCLDDKRLGKQRVEAMQILNALEPGSTSRWKNHPTVRMWRGYEAMLMIYHDVAITTWMGRGFNNSMRLRLCRVHITDKDIPRLIPWLTDEFCAAHRSNLLRKQNEADAKGIVLTHSRESYSYHDLDWTEPDDLPYIWPV